MTATNKWTLASASPRRREILENLGLKFQIRPSLHPEPPRLEGEEPPRYALRIARQKAAEAARRCRSGIVIGADTVVVVGDRILGKPTSRADAGAMLRSLSGRWHEVITGVCLVDCGTGRRRSAASTSRVHFRRLSVREIERYLDTREHEDKAGGYAIQGYAALFIDRIEGCYFNIVGFPVATFERLCRRLGIELLPQKNRPADAD